MVVIRKGFEMKKIITLSAIFMCMAPYAANAGSLDVHGEIKVNGNTVIDAKGNYVGTLPSNGPSMISLNDYYNQDGLKKTFKQVQLASENQTADEGVRIRARARTFFKQNMRV